VLVKVLGIVVVFSGIVVVSDGTVVEVVRGGIVLVATEEQQSGNP
jgi:hypothetical protein